MSSFRISFDDLTPWQKADYLEHQRRDVIVAWGNAPWMGRHWLLKG